jgi:hypothetical protein
MKYIVGASIGGLFGFSVPIMMDIEQINSEESPRIEVPQPVEEDIPVPIEESLNLPDDICGYIQYESTDIKEQAKECLKRTLPAMPAI